MSKAH